MSFNLFMGFLKPKDSSGGVEFLIMVTGFGSKPPNRNSEFFVTIITDLGLKPSFRKYFVGGIR